LGVSTDGQICFGIKLEEGVELPWDQDEWENDIETWWRDGVCGYKPPFEMFDAAGEWIGGKEWPMEKRKEYYSHRDQFELSMPKLPIELVNYCSANCGMYIIAVPGTVNSCSRGYPQAFGPGDLEATEDQRLLLLEFCRKYEIEIGDEQPKWWLSSYWG
jgi:hypothetical protein